MRLCLASWLSVVCIELLPELLPRKHRWRREKAIALFRLGQAISSAGVKIRRNVEAGKRYHGSAHGPLERALEVDDTFAYSLWDGEHAHSNLAVVLHQQDKHAEAEYHYRRATTLRSAQDSE